MDYKSIVNITEEGKLLVSCEGLDVNSFQLSCALEVVLKLGAAANGRVVNRLGVGQGVGQGKGGGLNLACVICQ